VAGARNHSTKKAMSVSESSESSLASSRAFAPATGAVKIGRLNRLDRRQMGMMWTNGEWRTEARKLKEMVAQFYEGAGSKLAAYEEFPSTLRYETRVNDSGEVEEKLVGIAFTPEPFINTARRVARVLLFQLATALVFAIAWALFCVGCWPMCE